jgi:hypothetical protein
MSKMADPVVPIPRFEELSPVVQARSRRATARLGVTVNSVHAFAHSEELGGATRDLPPLPSPHSDRKLYLRVTPLARSSKV